MCNITDDVIFGFYWTFVMIWGIISEIYIHLDDYIIIIIIIIDTHIFTFNIIIIILYTFGIETGNEIF